MPQKKKKCDNTSVAAIVKDSQNRILLIERKKYNPGFALPTGHEDGDGAEKALIKSTGPEAAWGTFLTLSPWGRILLKLKPVPPLFL